MSNIETLTKQVQRLKNQKQSLKISLDKANTLALEQENKLDILTDEVATKDAVIITLAVKPNALEQELIVSATAIEELESNLAQLEKELSDTKEMSRDLMTFNTELETELAAALKSNGAEVLSAIRNILKAAED